MWIITDRRGACDEPGAGQEVREEQATECQSEYYTRGGKTQERDIREVDGLLK